jgi:pimeloyl-ACP methyl ester carboxylesterase
MLYITESSYQDSGASESGVVLKSKLLLLLLAALAAGTARSQTATGDSTLELSACRIRAGEGYPGIEARCGTFLRPEDPSNPDSPLLSLRVAIVPALSLEPEPDPLVPIAGGPGQGSIAFYAGYAQAFAKIRRERNILLLDQRGTGDSATMQCDVSEEVIEGQYSVEQTLEETRKCLAALPYDPRYFTTSVAVQDLEALRIALGIQQLNLYGVSYGTRVAQHYLRRYPGATRTVILDGVVPPAVALGPIIAIEAQKALDAIFARCADSAACNKQFPDLRHEFIRLKDDLAQEAVSLELPGPVSGRPQQLTFGDGELAAAIRLLSYHPNSVALIPLLVHEAATGNYAPLASQFLMIADGMSDALSLGMHNSVVCAEDLPFIDKASISREALEQTYIGPLQTDALAAICSIWPRGVVDDDFKMPVTSNTPVLLLSGEADPITPPYFADQVAATLGNARHLTGAWQGHGQAMRGCMPDILGRFVKSASINDLGEACYARVFAMPFFLDFSGPAP